MSLRVRSYVRIPGILWSPRCYALTAIVSHSSIKMKLEVIQTRTYSSQRVNTTVSSPKSWASIRKFLSLSPVTQRRSSIVNVVERRGAQIERKVCKKYYREYSSAKKDVLRRLFRSVTRSTAAISNAGSIVLRAKNSGSSGLIEGRQCAAFWSI